MNFKTWLAHTKMFWLGDKELENKGKEIPCKNCNQTFKSYTHYGSGGLTYDTLCESCKKTEMELVRN